MSKNKHVITLSDYRKEQETLTRIVETRDEATQRLRERLNRVNDIITGIELNNIVEFKNNETKK